MFRHFVIYITSFLPSYICIWLIRMGRLLLYGDGSSLTMTLGFLGIVILMTNFCVMMHNEKQLGGNLMIAQDTFNATSYINLCMWIIQLVATLFGISGNNNLFSLIIILIVTGFCVGELSMLFAVPLLTVFHRGHLFIISIDDPEGGEPLPVMIITEETIEDGDLLNVHVSDCDVHLADKLDRKC